MCNVRTGSCVEAAKMTQGQRDHKQPLARARVEANTEKVCRVAGPSHVVRIGVFVSDASLVERKMRQRGLCVSLAHPRSGCRGGMKESELSTADPLVAALIPGLPVERAMALPARAFTEYRIELTKGGASQTKTVRISVPNIW